MTKESPHTSAQSTSITIWYGLFSIKVVAFWACLSLLIHFSVHAVENMEWEEPEKPVTSALIKEIDSVRDVKYKKEVKVFYDWMVKEIKSEASRGETTVGRTMNWGRGNEKHKPFSKDLSHRIAVSVAAKLEANGLDTTLNWPGSITVELD